MSNALRSGYEAADLPIHWLANHQEEPEEITRQKLEQARALGVPAVLFTEDQVTARVNELAQRELKRYAAEYCASEVLYLLLLQGGAYLSQEYFRRMGKQVPGFHIEQDSIGVERIDTQGWGPPTTAITKAITRGTRVGNKHVVLLDAAANTGNTARTISGWLTDPTWTVNNQVGCAAASVGLRVLTARDSTNIEGFEPEEVDVGFLTPYCLTLGSGAADKGSRHRWSPGIFIAPEQPREFRDSVAETLELLGEAAAMTIDQIVWAEH